ncbi:uncharacterized protein DUF222 [Microbacterium sp. AG1240]|uniref:HNH endonuclease signature motif containing protein n=1 Tax=Microbacterium sp. AG1240 TaxID=2183992 RepID=UPI000EB253DE|nr:HNH endonuclease signature motif containing protein [Microbacterium sp. AG1240]RKT31097.1 uncharacterized protein DUF222 [Microbacterium sp. AG1240]
MSFFEEIHRHLGVLRDVVGEVDAGALPTTVAEARDADVMRVIRESTRVIEALASLRIAASGVLAARSRREQGHDGAAAGEGHRSAVSLVQEIAGTTRTEAAKQVRLGESLLDGANLLGGARAPSADDEADAADAVDAGDDAGTGTASRVREPWHASLGRAQLAGTLSAAQHHAILHGLGDPPAPGDDAVDAEFAEAWSLAASQLTEEAAHRTVEELAAAARTIRDRLDPVGAEQRFAARFDGRSFRMWKDTRGVSHGHLIFDDESAAFLRSVFDSALRPRRGGPRFVADDEKAAAAELRDDPRTNTQLEFDLLLDILRAGVLADAKAVHGTRQAGVRIVVTDHAWQTSHDGTPAVAHLEDGLAALPAWVAAQRACDGGTRTVWVDGAGEPLRLGREQRLFSAGQRLTLALRDGGCRWRGCDRPASMCEAHHIDPYSEGGRTDTDRGILLCRFHHMHLHHHRWRITREGHGDFVLHPPPGKGAPIVLTPRLALTYAWADIPPPLPRFRTSPGAAARRTRPAGRAAIPRREPLHRESARDRRAHDRS